MIEKFLRKKTLSWKGRLVLRIFQHICIAVVIAILYYIIIGSSIKGSNGKEYHISNSDYGNVYEDSELFNTILKDNLSNVTSYIANCTLMETDGEYDPGKTVDVTAFVNRNSMLQGDYVSAIYRISDLVKWSQNGFEYDEKTFTTSESSNFLNNNTIYTHLVKNNAEGGMNSFLNSRLSNNTIRKNVNLNTVYDGSGTHTILVPRYKTIYDENIQDIVATWDAYNSLCANVTEAASTMAANYDSYVNNKKKYGFYKSNLRYYITRTINARTEIYTNVESLKRSANGVDIGNAFKTYGKYIYYCPYEIDYETNTRVSEDQLRNILGDYSYAFTDQMKFYFAVDTGNMSRQDDFSVGKEAFTKYMPYYKQFYLGILLFAIFYVVVILHISYYEGYVEHPDGTKGGLERIDKLPIEAVLLISIVLILLFAGVFRYFLVNYRDYAANTHYKCMFAFIIVFFMDNAFSMFLYTFIRRIRLKALYKTSLINRLVEAVKRFSEKLSVKQNIILRAYVPYVVSVIINFLLVLKWDIIGIAIAVVMNTAIGIYIYNLNNDKIVMLNALYRMQKGELDIKIDLSKIHGTNIYFARELNTIAGAVEEAVNRSMRDEKLKADLITNVSHDIKTPLTSIINYVDLLKRENIQDPKAREYIDILENKAQRLRQLTDDLVEASKVSSGNITLHPEQINYAEIVNQIMGEFYEKFDDSNLTPILKCEKYDVLIMADPRQLYRVIENLLNNVCKYALSGTRVYLDLEVSDTEDGVHEATFSVKNISKNELNIKADELTERFIRGDISRSTEGSGLGLSIAKSLTNAMGGKFNIILDGDLFKVNVTFDTTHFSKGNPSAETEDVKA